MVLPAPLSDNALAIKSARAAVGRAAVSRAGFTTRSWEVEVPINPHFRGLVVWHRPLPENGDPAEVLDTYSHARQ